MSEWWDSLDTFEMVFWLIAAPSTVLFIIQMGLTLFGGADGDVADGGADLDVGHGDVGGGDGAAGGGWGGADGFGASFRLFAVRNVIIFFAVFAWAGIVGINAEWSHAVVIIFAFVLGLAVMTLVAFLFYSVSKLSETGTENIATAMGASGTVYLTVPGHNKWLGKVQVSMGGRVRELDAMTTGDGIPNGTAIRVTKVVERKFVIVDRLDAGFCLELLREAELRAFFGISLVQNDPGSDARARRFPCKSWY